MKHLLAIAAALALPAAAVAQTPALRALRAIDRADAGDTTVVVLHFDASPAVQVSEPFHLADRVRLHVDLDQTTASPDSVALATLARGNLIAISPHERLGGTALAIDVRTLGSYHVQQTDSTVTLRLAVAPPASPRAAVLPPTSTKAHGAPLRRERDAAGSPLLLLALLPGTVLLWLLRNHRPPMPGHSALQRQPAATSSPAPDARVWAARALTGDGLGEGEVARRTGLAREALRLLEPEAVRPADSAARGSICRTDGGGRTRH